MTERTYKFNSSRLTLRFGDIVTADTKIIVSSDDCYLTMGGGVSEAILEAAGNEIALDATKKVPAKLGDVVITSAGRLKAEYIFHAITLGEGGMSAKEIINSTTSKCLTLMDTLNLTSIAFPTIGAGFAEFDYDEVALQMSETISEHLLRSDDSKEVVIYLFDRFNIRQPIDYINFFEAFARKSLVLKKENILSETEPERFASKEKVFSETENERKAKRIHSLRSFLSSLEEQRNRLEQKLISLLETDNNSEYDSTKSKLRENEDLRLSRLKELKELTSDKDRNNEKNRPPTPTIFVSSTYRDLIDCRNAIKEQIARRKMIFIGMEHFGASPEDNPPASLIVDEVRKADVYVGVFGVRYGYIDEATGLSMTELEYREAKLSNKPILLYVIKDSANVKISDIEDTQIGREKLSKLKNEILAERVVYRFETIPDLERQVFEDLGKI